MRGLSEGKSLELIDLIGGLNRQFEQAIETQIKPLGLSIEQYRVLEALDRRDGQPMGELATTVFVDSPTFTKIIDRMIANGDVYRAPDPGDRRRVLIFKSEKGAVRLADLRRRLKSTRSTIIHGLDSTRAEQLRYLLQAMLRPN
ncbi:hypothetical protein LMIY3S_00149 [Labrys miyagiensis]